MSELPKKHNITVEDVIYYKDDFEDLIFTCNVYPITMEQIAKISVLLGKIALQGKLDTYIRVLFDASKVES